MSTLLIHWYQNAEVYAVLLVWVVVPLGFYATLLFFTNHYGIFLSQELKQERKEDGPN